MKSLILLALVGCGASSDAIGSLGSVAIGQQTYGAQLMQRLGDTSAPTTFVGWSITFVNAAPGSPCTGDDVAELGGIVLDKVGTSQDVAPLDPGRYQVAGQVIAANQYFAHVYDLSGNEQTSGIVTIAAADATHLEGGFNTAGLSGAFSADMCTR